MKVYVVSEFSHPGPDLPVGPGEVMLAKQHPAYGGAAVGGGEDLAVRDQSPATKWFARELGLDETDLRKTVNC